MQPTNQHENQNNGKSNLTTNQGVLNVGSEDVVDSGSVGLRRLVRESWFFFKHFVLWILTIGINMVVSIVVGVPPIAGWFTRESPIKMDDLGVPPYNRKPPYKYKDSMLQ